MRHKNHDNAHDGRVVLEEVKEELGGSNPYILYVMMFREWRE